MPEINNTEVENIAGKETTASTPDNFEDRKKLLEQSIAEYHGPKSSEELDVKIRKLKEQASRVINNEQLPAKSKKELQRKINGEIRSYKTMLKEYEQMIKMRELMESPDFNRLLPDFKEYISQKTAYERPLIHGTGSYALAKILHEGFKPQKGQETLVGENTAHRTRMDENRANPVSFATPDVNGNKISHWYATLPCKNLSLKVNSENCLGPRTTRVINEVYGGLDTAISAELKKELDQFGIKDPKLVAVTKKEIEKDIRNKMVSRMRTAANVFNPELTQQNVRALDKILKGEINDPEKAAFYLREVNLLNIIRTDRNGNPVPRYKTAELIQHILQTVVNPDSWAHKIISEATDELIKKMENYNSLSAEDRNSVENQFPCFLIVEGKGLTLTESQWMKATPEIQSFKDVPPSAIKEIHVPEAQIGKVQEMLNFNGLKGVKIVPFEFFEMKEVLDHLNK